MSFKLPDLPYAHDALAPYMSRETLEYHHDKHHKAYVDTGNKLLEGSGLEGKSLEEIVKGSFGKNAGLFNNAGQHYNHSHFWQWMKPNGGGDKLPGKLQAAIDKDLGGLAKMKEDFSQAGMTQFGSGWAWIAVKDGKLAIMKTPNGENPLVHGGSPILGADVWEHSYYIDYRNRRADYLKAFLDHLVNWDHVNDMFSAATKYLRTIFLFGSTRRPAGDCRPFAFSGQRQARRRRLSQDGVMRESRAHAIWRSQIDAH
jgi:Fe-Mn family superoxide dismutase